MTRTFIVLLVVTVVVGALQDAPGAEPATQPQATAPSRPRAAMDPAVERILDHLEKKGDGIKDLKADIRYVKIDPVLEGKQVYTGKLFYRVEEPSPRFLIHFTRAVIDDEVENTQEWHAFDGQLYTEAREKTKTIIPRRIVEPGEKVEVYRLGKGPFPLPFGQKKADIAEHFEVRLVPPTGKDPANTDHLECTPLPDTEMERKFGTVHFYIDRKLELPVKVVTVQKEDETEISASFENLQLNTGFAGSEVNLPDLKARGYTEPEPAKR